MIRKFKPDLNRLREKGYAKNLIVSFLRYFFLISIGYIVLFQLFYMLSYAFRTTADMSNPSVVWVPRVFTMENFGLAVEQLDYLKSFWNTLSIQVVSGIVEVISCAVAAYGFARFKFPFKNVLFFMVIITIVVPSQMISVPLYLNYAKFNPFGIVGIISKIAGTDLRPNLLDGGLVFYLPSIFASGLRSGLFIFIYRQFFVSLPLELEEAASIDGAGPLKTFIGIILPSSGSALLTVSIFSVVWHWNEYYLSALYFEENYPLSVKLSSISAGLEQGQDNRGLRMAACLMFVIPVLIMYAILQKKFIKSIDRVGIVG